MFLFIGGQRENAENFRRQLHENEFLKEKEDRIHKELEVRTGCMIKFILGCLRSLVSYLFIYVVCSRTHPYT